MSSTEKFGKPKKVIRPKIFLTLLSWVCIVLGIFFAFGMMKEYFRSISLGRIKPDGLFIIPLITIIMLFLFVGAGLMVMKQAKKIYLYEDGFVVGKETEKNEYKNLHYFFIPGTMPNTFMAIFYEAFDGSYRNIPGTLYPTNAFQLLQQDIVKLTFPTAMENIEQGGSEEFSFIAPKKNVFALGKKKVEEKMKKEMEKADKIKITKDYFAIEDEIYNWNEHKISGKFGNIVVDGLDGRKIVRLPKLRVDRPNLLEALIGNLGEKK